MSFTKSVIFCFFTCILFIKCGKSEDRKNLELREMKVSQKEEQLNEREKLLEFKGRELLKREQTLDSLQNVLDTSGIYNPKLIGTWLVNMKCIETSCEGSALGDTKTERWNISYQNHIVVATALSNQTVTRSYSGLYKESGLTLVARQNEGWGATTITVTLDQTSDNKMEGKREINRGGGCKIVYAIELVKAQTIS